MYVCRAAWQTVTARLTRASFPASLKRSPGATLRHMSSGSVADSSGRKLFCSLGVGIASITGGYYAYKTVSSNKARYDRRVQDIQDSSTEWKPRVWPPQDDEGKTMETTEAREDVTDASTEGTEAITVKETPVQNDISTVSTEVEREKELQVEDASAVEEVQQEVAASSEATHVQETVEKALDVAALPALEENINGVQQGIALTAEEMPATSSKDQEAEPEAVAESVQASEGSGESKGSEEVSKDT